MWVKDCSGARQQFWQSSEVGLSLPQALDSPPLFSGYKTGINHLCELTATLSTVSERQPMGTERKE